MGSTWNNSRSQLHGGYVKVNSAAKERPPHLVFSNTGLCTCSLRTGVQNPPLSFSFSSKICDHWGWKWNEARAFIERFDWCPQNGTITEIKLFAKASSFDEWHCETWNRTECGRMASVAGWQVWQAVPSPGAPTMASKGKLPFSLNLEKCGTIPMFTHTLSTQNGFLCKFDTGKKSISISVICFPSMHPSRCLPGNFRLRENHHVGPESELWSQTAWLGILAPAT